MILDMDRESASAFPLSPESQEDRDMTSQQTEPATSGRMVYVPGIGYITQEHKALRDRAKTYCHEITSRTELSEDLSVVWHVMDETKNRVRIVIHGLNRRRITAAKSRLAETSRAIHSAIKLYEAKVRGYKVWCCYFSDGNFNDHACGFEIELPAPEVKS